MPGWLKPVLLASCLAALSAVLISCNQSNLAQVRLVHAIESTDAVNFEVNGTNDFPEVGFGQLSPARGYKQTASGIVTFTGVVVSTSNRIFETPDIKLFGTDQYTVVAAGNAVSISGGNADIIAALDNNNTPNNGTVSFRVIHASPDAPASLDIYILPAQETTLTPPATVSALDYQGVSEYINVPYNSAGSGYIVYVCDAGTTTPLFEQAIKVGGANEGSIRTLVITDQPNAAALNPQFVVLNDLH
jgi:hypothetical protein